jgi:hypothetical protein
MCFQLSPSFDVSTLEQHLNEIRLLPPEEVQELLVNVIPQAKLPMEYLNRLETGDRTAAFRACLLAWSVTSGTQVPREMQLCATLATYNELDSLIDAGTGNLIREA